MERQAKGDFMAEQDSSFSEDIKSQNKSSAGRIKIIARAIWSLTWPILLGAIGILMIIASMTYVAPKDRSKSQTARLQIAEFEGALDAFIYDNGSNPTNEQGLEALVRDNEKGGPYLKKGVPLDPWGRPYHYRNPGVHNPNSYEIWSDGVDGIGGTADDIVNWE
jgi:general secretion pathway protein G